MKRSALIVAAIAALAVGTPAGAAPVFVIHGYGWGHGIGLSQYGAAGLANNGATHAQILAHYYRGTTLGTVEATQMRVLVHAPGGSFKVSSDSPFTVRGSDGTTVDLAAGAATVTPKLVVRSGAERHTLAPPLMFVPGASPLAVAGRPYRGVLNVHDTSDGVLVVNELPLEQYLYGVVPEEMPTSWATEALQAQAVAARSYAIATRRTKGVFDAYADTRSQVYGGLDAEELRSTSAVDATRGVVVLHDGSVATTFFFSTSGGRTAAIEDVWRGSNALPYLRSVDDPTDAHSPHHRWGPIVLARKQLQRALKGLGPRGIRDVTTTTNASGRVDLFVMAGSGSQAAIDGATARTALGLRSTGFSVGLLDLVSPKQPAAFRQKVTIRGVARNVESATLEVKSDGRWEHLREVAPNANGDVRVRLRPTRGMTLRLHAPELTGSGVRAPQVRLAVNARVTLQKKRRGVFTGVVRPKEAGTAVALERRGKRRWRRVARSETGRAGQYRFRLKPRPAGDYRVVATVSSDGVGAGASKSVNVPR